MKNDKITKYKKICSDDVNMPIIESIYKCEKFERIDIGENKYKVITMIDDNTFAIL